MSDFTITKDKLQRIADVSNRHNKAVINDIMEKFADSPATAYPLAIGYIVAMAMNEVKGPERQNFVKLLNSAMANCSFALTPVQDDHDT
ncbi:hypothetical protein [Bradyrhizobium septentrionale]|uniref:Uncharacterized protein n=1 Tax=Bradyrhizobium septentrionale TaxID=1404411 RepID=A0A973W666_9BRAD|nr:hypothetical protein [Bradyrhizobium septentrionale]UGY16725.1 hypothetical protein HAP48_0004005 [Bradyrhizobium septentrionale]UGY25381.1 hypothetical protein HU675_0047355 [Bradyrhizobium septentrionale]